MQAAAILIHRQGQGDYLQNIRIHWVSLHLMCLFIQIPNSRAFSFGFSSEI